MNNVLRIFSWPRTLGICLLALFLGKFIMRNVVMDASSTVHVDVAIGMLISRGLLEMYAAWDRQRRAAKTDARPREAALSVLGRKALAMARFSVALSIGFCSCLLRRRPHKPALPGTRIHYMNNSQYATILAIVLISIFADMPISAMLVGVIEHDPERRQIIHVLIAVMTLISLIFILGDRWHVKGECHRIDEGIFHLRIGKRVAADLPVCRIAAVEAMRGNKAGWCKEKGQSPRDVIQISPVNIADKPNICLTISDGAPIRMRSNLFECDLPKYVLLFVDEPGALIRAIHAHSLAVPSAADD